MKTQMILNFSETSPAFITYVSETQCLSAIFWQIFSNKKKLLKVPKLEIFDGVFFA
jgi:hypothetical protein